MLTVVASWDDGSKEDMRLAELMSKYGIENVIFYIPAEWQTYNWNEGREPLNLHDINTLEEEFEIGSHSISHALLTRMPMDRVEYEIRESKYMLEQLLDCTIGSFCYPRGYANVEIKELVRSHYTHARNTLVGNLEPAKDLIWETPTVHAGGKRRKEYENTTWLYEGVRLLQEAIKLAKEGKDAVYHIWGHSWELSRYDAWGDLEILLKEIDVNTPS